MLNFLTTTLKAILDSPDVTPLVRDADIAFERPADGYAPGKTTINLFLYDIRESTELRNNEPIVNRQNGVATLRRPPLRLACSYQVTAWIDSSVTGEDATLKQHQLLSETLKVFSRMPIIDDKFLQGDLAASLYPVSLTTAQADLVRNPAEFWSAMGGKLRPSFTVTATIAMDQNAPAITLHEVSSHKITLQELDVGIEETLYRIGGTVRAGDNQMPLESVEITLVELGRQTESNGDGQFTFSGVAAGSYSLRVGKTGYSTGTTAIKVPGTSPSSFDIELKP